jgi:hypothetical protein
VEEPGAGIGAGGIGARGIEGAARSVCARRRYVAAIGVDPVALVARHLTAEVATAQLSPFAVEAGARFEHSLYADDCALLRASYLAADLEPFCTTDVSVETPVEVVVVGGRDGADDGTAGAQSSAELVAATLRALTAPGVGIRIVVQGVLDLAVGARSERIRPDVLVGDLAARRWWVGEAKSYLDRGGATSRSHVGHACGQLAVGVVALARTLDTACQGGAGSVASSGDLFLFAHRRGATVHRLDLGLEIRCVEAFLGEAHDLGEHADPTELFARIDALDAIPAQFEMGCRESCSLYELCASRELVPAGLGDGARHVVARLGGLERAVRLARGDEEPAGGEISVVAALRSGFGIGAARTASDRVDGRLARNSST